jgi:hypothetical protein
MEGALLIDFIPCQSPKATASVTYAPKITQKIAPRTVQGILRVIAFVLLCIGVALYLTCRLQRFAVLNL